MIYYVYDNKMSVIKKKTMVGGSQNYKYDVQITIFQT